MATCLPMPPDQESPALDSASYPQLSPHLSRMKPFFLFTFAIFTAVQAETTQNFVNQAISSNPEIRYYEAEIAAAKASKRTAGQRANPELSTELGYKHESMSSSSASGAVWKAEISQSFDFPGRIGLRKAIADRDIALAELGLMQFKSLLGNEIRARAGDMILMRRKVEASRSVRQRLEELIAVLVQRDSGNVSAKLERRILEASLLTSDRSLTDAQKEINAATTGFNLLCGRAPDAKVELDEGLISLPSAPTLADLKGKAAQSNYDLQQKRVQLARQGLKIDLSKSDRWGNFTFGTYVSGEYTAGRETEGGLVFSIPLPLWNRNEGNIAGEQARQQQAEAMLAMTLRDLERDLTLQRADYAAEMDALSHWRPETEKEFQEAAEEADRHYRLGAVTAATYVEMQRGYLDALDALIETRRNAWKHLMELEKLTGSRLLSK